jgi:hypothetical protein
MDGHQPGDALNRPSHPTASLPEVRARTEISRLLTETPIPPEDLTKNLGLYQSKESVATILAMNDVYRRIRSIPGVIMEFGSLWGRRLALLIALREIYEPYDYTRRIIGFDTFTGLPDLHRNDGSSVEVRPGSMSVPPDYARHLEQVLHVHEMESCHAHVQRFEVRQGDVRRTLPEYLTSNPETIVSLAYFDLDLYEPTIACLEALRPRLVPGSILAFDQLVHRNFPGETIAVLESLGLRLKSVEKLPYLRSPSIVTV